MALPPQEEIEFKHSVMTYQLQKGMKKYGKVFAMMFKMLLQEEAKRRKSS